MKLKLKHYKFKITKEFLKTKLLFILYKLEQKNNIKFKQTLIKHNFVPTQINNNITKKLLKYSILKNLQVIIQGPVILLKQFSNENFNIKLKNLNKDFFILGLKLNNKIYSITQIKSLNNFILKKNLKNLYVFIKLLFKKPFEIM